MRCEDGLKELNYAVLMVDAGGGLIACSNKAREILSLPENAIGKNMGEICPGLVPFRRKGTEFSGPVNPSIF